MPTDIAKAQRARLKPIAEVAARLGIDSDYLEPYGRHKAKISFEAIDRASANPEGKLILVTAMSPTPPGEGKTTTSIGLTDGLNRIGKRAVACLREPAIGPTFGLKGGATGGGYAQVAPMEEINLHFTGDFHAIQIAHNLLAALIDNHIHHGNELGFDPRRVTWKRVLDMNDRSLREIVVSLGGMSNGVPRQDGFDIVVASEVMAIFCLALSIDDLKERLGKIVVGHDAKERPILARELGAAGAMAAILKDALMPSLVQTLENNPAIIHGGPFANIAHGCSSVLATKLALRLGEYVVTEAGFGADLGAEKFMDIKCRKSGLRPDAAVVVATIRALKYHGGMHLKSLETEDLVALRAGAKNLERHLENVRNLYGLPCVVALNLFNTDTAAEIETVREIGAKHGVEVVIARHWAEGGAGAADLAKAVVGLAESGKARPAFVYEDSLPLWEKARAVAQKVYGAADISADRRVRQQVERYQNEGYGHFPVCMAKTPYSFSTDAALLGAPSGHTVQVREVRLAAGAEFVVFVCGDLMTMPGLPKVPAATRIDVDSRGRISGIS